MVLPLSICWFRQDLRLADNPALAAAAERGRVLSVFILDDVNSGADKIGAASRWWLHHSLTALKSSLNGALYVTAGDALILLPELVKSTGADAVFWNRSYEKWRIQRDTEVKSRLQDDGVEAVSSNGSLLWEPWEIAKNDGTPFKVFTPFYRRGCLAAAPPREPMPAPQITPMDQPPASDITSLGLLPDQGWDEALAPHWQIGEVGAKARLDAFLDEGLDGYKDGRNIPAAPNVSRLSPHLHWGEISVNQVWQAARARDDVPSSDVDNFCSELGWREFSHALLFYNPDLRRTNLQSKFDRFGWRDDADLLQAWQRGRTGVPFVDAAMRELRQTGYMHNRMRMVTGSFLVKNLRLHWHHGEAWFWDCLVDADHASNSASWQWIAGCGADAAPYFRIFNSVTQGQKFDPDGSYTRRYVPELAGLPDKYLFAPWLAPDEVLADAGVQLGKTYPRPVVDLKESREAALAAFQALKELS
ncbi:DNA photolyase family protein [Alphaproteobacteria bacterium]|nr:DNA photolyase family protein [Alphaproteobacteria bacterium]